MDNYPAGSSMAMSENISELARKVAEVMSEIEEPERSGHNDYHGYDYPTDDDVMSVVRPKLAEKNLAAIPSLVGTETTKRETRDGVTYHTRAYMNITIIDADSGEYCTVAWQGEASDTQDKGLYKAYTSGIKYWALKTFLLSATDVETDDVTGEPGRGGGRGLDPTEGQLEYAEDLAKKDVFTEQETADRLAKIDEADRQEISEMIDRMKGEIAKRKRQGPPQQRQGPPPNENKGNGKAPIPKKTQKLVSDMVERLKEAYIPTSDDTPEEVLNNCLGFIEEWPDRQWKYAVDKLREYAPDGATIPNRAGEGRGGTSSGSSTNTAENESEQSNEPSQTPDEKEHGWGVSDREIPDNFPGAAELKEDGYQTVKEVARSIDMGVDLQGTPGIGPVTDEDIRNTIEAVRKGEIDLDEEIPF